MVARTLTVTMVVLGLALSTGCGPSVEALRADAALKVVQDKFEAQVRATEAENVKLRKLLDAAKKRLEALERRAGIKPMDTTHLSRPPSVMSVRPNVGTLVSGQGDPGKKGSLKKHLQKFDGYVVAFWATWCKPCTSDEELAHLKDLRRQLRAANVELVSMAIDDLDKVLGDSRAHKWLYPLWHKQDGHIDMVPKALIEKVGLNLPLFLVVDRNGRLKYYRNRKLDHQTVEDLVTVATPRCKG